MYECGCNDYPRTEVFCYEKDPFGHADSSMSGSIDGKGGSYPFSETYGRCYEVGMDIPSVEPIKMTKRADIRSPSLPSYSLPPSHPSFASSAPGTAVARACRAIKKGICSIWDMMSVARYDQRRDASRVPQHSRGLRKRWVRSESHSFEREWTVGFAAGNRFRRFKRQMKRTQKAKDVNGKLRRWEESLGIIRL